MTYVLHGLAFFLGGLAGIWLASLCTISKLSDLQGEVHRLRKRLYEQGHQQ